MSKWDMRIERDTQEREAIKAKNKQPPDIVMDFEQAMVAWTRFRRFEGLASSAYGQYMRSGMGTETARQHRIRFEAYSDLADGWEDVLYRWIRDNAQIARDGRKQEAFRHLRKPERL
ncbi:hypothetical protein [Hyphomicrobium sp. DY-1]|uniref:hypothetical protein n=1 Tax=Hyphomicrobium sp. DY-1 TaxID=3075650 RepID=UPI0039C1861C